MIKARLKAALPRIIDIGVHNSLKSALDRFVLQLSDMHCPKAASMATLATALMNSGVPLELAVQSTASVFHVGDAVNSDVIAALISLRDDWKEVGKRVADELEEDPGLLIKALQCNESDDHP